MGRRQASVVELVLPMDRQLVPVLELELGLEPVPVQEQELVLELPLVLVWVWLRMVDRSEPRSLEVVYNLGLRMSMKCCCHYRFW